MLSNVMVAGGSWHQLFVAIGYMGYWSLLRDFEILIYRY